MERQAQAQAIENFKGQASALAQGFGFAGYSLREVAVNSNDSGPGPRPRMMAMEAKFGGADAPVPVEAGKSTVEVTVSGSVPARSEHSAAKTHAQQQITAGQRQGQRCCGGRVLHFFQPHAADWWRHRGGLQHL